MNPSSSILLTYDREVKRLKRALKALSIFGVSTRKDAIEAAARKATVRDLAMHCTDKEIAAFLHTSEVTILKERRQLTRPRLRLPVATLPPKYPTYPYQRVIPLIEPVREAFRVPPMPTPIPQPEPYQEPVFAFA